MHPDTDRIKSMVELREQGKSYREVARIFRISQGTVHEILNGRKDKNNRKKALARVRELSTK